MGVKSQNLLIYNIFLQNTATQKCFDPCIPIIRTYIWYLNRVKKHLLLGSTYVSYGEQLTVMSNLVKYHDFLPIILNLCGCIHT